MIENDRQLCSGLSDVRAGKLRFQIKPIETQQIFYIPSVYYNRPIRTTIANVFLCGYISPVTIIPKRELIFRQFCDNRDVSPPSAGPQCQFPVELRVGLAVGLAVELPVVGPQAHGLSYTSTP